MNLRFLIIDGYTRAAREELAAGGASIAADLYSAMLEQWSPVPVACDKLYPSDPDRDMPSPEKLYRYDGVAWTGCSLGCNDDSAEVADQIQLQRDIYEVGIPSFGSCWAAQIAVVAAGGRVTINPKGREMGISRKIGLTNEGLGHPMHTGRRAIFDAFTSHDDEISQLPSGGVVLSGNAFSDVQSVCVTHGNGTFWGVQYHPEYDLHELARLTFCRIEKLSRKGFFQSRDHALAYVDDLEQLHQDATRKDLAWKLGIDDDVTNANVRCTEVRNWIRQMVIPTKLTNASS
ncbi:type 1 glutamine amidotransferase [bacterium]|nr:type 1 glutamine amidotransferase [bacterium]